MTKHLMMPKGSRAESFLLLNLLDSAGSDPKPGSHALVATAAFPLVAGGNITASCITRSFTVHRVTTLKCERDADIVNEENLALDGCPLTAKLGSDGPKVIPRTAKDRQSSVGDV